VKRLCELKNIHQALKKIFADFAFKKHQDLAELKTQFNSN